MTPVTKEYRYIGEATPRNDAREIKRENTRLKQLVTGLFLQVHVYWALH